MEDGNQRGMKPQAAGNEPLRPDGDTFLFVVGIDAYSGAPRLNNARKDAETFRDILLDRYQCTQEHLIELYDAEATRSHILRQLLELAGRIGARDSLVVYFSGHGEFNERLGEGFWIPVEGRLKDHSTYISFAELLKHLEAIPAFHTVVIADACYAGSLFVYRNLNAEAYERLDRFPSRWLLTSGRNEPVPDGPPGTHSPFADQLLWQLRNNEQALLSISELGQRLVRAVAQGSNPTPRCEPLHVNGHRGGEFVFRLQGKAVEDEAPPAAPPPVQVELRAPAAGDAEARADLPADPDHFSSLRALQRTVQAHVIADDLARALTLLNNVLDFGSPLQTDVILLRARLSDWEKEKRRGTTSGENLNVTRNQIRYALTEYLRMLSAKDIDPEVLG